MSQLDVSSRRDRVSPIQNVGRSSRPSSTRTLGVGEEIEIHHSKKNVAPPKDPAFSFNFFDRSPVVRTARRTYLIEMAKGVLLVSIAIFCVFPIFWGSLWKLPAGRVNGWIVDFDGSTIGAFVTRRLVTVPTSFIHWHVVPAVNFPGGIPQVEHAVVEEKAWLAVTIAPDTTAQLNASLGSPNALYNASQAITVHGNEARNENLYRTFTVPTLTNILAGITSEIAVQNAKGQAANLNLAAILIISPQTIVEPVGFVITTVRPFNIPAASADMFIGLIYLTVISFTIVSIAYHVREEADLNRLLKFRSLVLLRLTTNITIYFLLSLFYTLLSRAFQIRFNRKFGTAGLVVYWMLNWAGMMALYVILRHFPASIDFGMQPAGSPLNH
ncbi:hypothetical protein AX14_009257 [Amanita brunnescens Koide BX004]|nr:hypothetical protein AX14_009257 [Amanita brunnescens Koide BX004]